MRSIIFPGLFLLCLAMPGAVPAGVAAAYPDFIISYWCGPTRAETTLERYREIAACGFNLAMPPADGADVATNRKILEACKQTGLKAILQDDRMPLKAGSPELERALDAIVADYAGHPALAGYFITDEPNASQFPTLGRINSYLLRKDPKRLPFINLFPNYASAQQLGTPTYDEHVSSYIKTVKPALVSWDHYQQMAGNESLYFKNLESVRRECLAANLPFMQIILSLPHYSYRNPGEADLRWQVYTSLAYGARGIMYFTYWTLPAWGLGSGPGIIDAAGKRDAKYDTVARLNGRLKALGPVLVQLKSTGVYATAPLPPGTTELPQGLPVSKAAGGPLLLGLFEDSRHAPWVMVVNRSFKERATAELTFDKAWAAASEISQETGKRLKAMKLKEHVLQAALEPGEGRLFLLKR